MLLLLEHDVEAELGRHRQLRRVKFAPVETAWHLVSLEVEHGVRVDSLGVVQCRLKVAGVAGFIAASLVASELAEELGHVKALDAALKGVVVVKLAQVGPVDAVLDHRVLLNLHDLAGLFVFLQCIGDVVMKRYLALLGFHDHGPRELLQSLLLIVHLLLHYLRCIGTRGCTARAEDAMADGRGFRRQSRSLRHRVLVREPTLEGAWNVAAEAFHSVGDSGGFGHELELLGRSVIVLLLLSLRRLIRLVVRRFVDLHRNQAASDRVCPFFRQLRLFHDVSTADNVLLASLHLGNLAGFQHPEGLGDVDRALLVVLGLLLVVDLDRPVVPAVVRA